MFRAGNKVEFDQAFDKPVTPHAETLLNGGLILQQCSQFASFYWPTEDRMHSDHITFGFQILLFVDGEYKDIAIRNNDYSTKTKQVHVP
jgi:hypothetical protein